MKILLQPLVHSPPSFRFHCTLTHQSERRGLARSEKLMSFRIYGHVLVGELMRVVGMDPFRLPMHFPTY